MGEILPDFDFTAKRKAGDVTWRAKVVETLPELLEVLHLRWNVYCNETGFTTPDEIRQKPEYTLLMDIARSEGLDPHDGEYEVDKHDRIEQILGMEPVDPINNGMTHILLALRDDDNGELELDGKRYTISSTERCVLDDHVDGVEDPVGLPMEPDFHLQPFREQRLAKDQRFTESGRLIKNPKEPGEGITALHRMIVFFSMDNGVYAPINVITSPKQLKGYYAKLGYSNIGDPFIYHKLGGEEWVAMELDLEMGRQFLLSIPPEKYDEPHIRKMFPRVEDLVYCFTPISEDPTQRNTVDKAADL